MPLTSVSLFHSKEDFLTAATTEAVTGITLVEANGWLEPELNMIRGVKYIIEAVEDGLIWLRDKNGGQRTLSIEGNWKFRGRCLVILDAQRELVLIVNPLFDSCFGGN